MGKTVKRLKAKSTRNAKENKKVRKINKQVNKTARKSKGKYPTYSRKERGK